MRVGNIDNVNNPHPFQRKKGSNCETYICQPKLMYAEL